MLAKASLRSDDSTGLQDEGASEGEGVQVGRPALHCFPKGLHHQECIRASISPHPGKHLLLFLFD